MKNRLFLSLLSATILFSCDQDDDDPQIIATSGNIETVAGQGTTSFEPTPDGELAINTTIGWAVGVATDADGNFYFTDGASNTLRKVDAGNRRVSTVAGTFVGFNVNDPTPYHGDGGPASAAHLRIPMQVAIDHDGNIFISDAGNSVIRQIHSSDMSISTAVGKGPFIVEFPGDGDAQSVGIWNPFGVAVDSDGNLYYADMQNNAVRKLNRSTGVVTTIAGLGPNEAGFSGDGASAVNARLSMPTGIAVDHTGAVYIADSGNKRIRKVSNGIITTIAGTGAAGYSGDLGPAVDATFSAGLKGIAVDLTGNLYIADGSNNVIRKIDLYGVITTIAGDGTAGYEGDGGPATSAHLSGPWGVAVDHEGNVYIADTNNGVIRMVGK
jgi:trimeric autotransporter adhesin